MTHDGQNGKERVAAAVQVMAHHLLDVLREETRCLTQGDHAALLEILPQKEALARRISESLRSLRHSEPSAATTVRDGAAWLNLKETLQRIEALNDANGRHIAELLRIQGELLSIMLPQTYGYGPPKVPPALKGCGLSTEA